MTPERTLELLPVMEHFANGGEVQSIPIEGVAFVWVDEPGPSWSRLRKYRKKPEPRVMLVTFKEDGSYVSRLSEELTASFGRRLPLPVKFVEVLDETD